MKLIIAYLLGILTILAISTSKEATVQPCGTLIEQRSYLDGKMVHRCIFPTQTETGLAHIRCSRNHPNNPVEYYADSVITRVYIPKPKLTP